MTALRTALRRSADLRSFADRVALLSATVTAAAETLSAGSMASAPG